MPDVRMNQGPLPSVAGGPVGTDGTPDGVINGTNRLLSGITPYAYGESARMGSDRNYQQVPHRVQYIVPPLYLPSQKGETTYRVSHAVDQGDLAFILMTRGRQWFSAGDTVTATGPGTLPLFGNLEVVNYILACLQVVDVAQNANHWNTGISPKRSWKNIRDDLWRGIYKDDYDREELRNDYDSYVQHMFECVMYTVENMLKPHGICAGSEHQGGQHEENWAPVQAAVNYTTTMTVDGQNRDLVNYWHTKTVYAGDRLILRLELVPKSEKEISREFQLTSYYERPVSAAVMTRTAYWQLKPWILNAKEDEEMKRFDYRLTAYWQIAQSFQGRHGSGLAYLVPPGAPLQVTFAPVFVRNGPSYDVEWDWHELLDKIPITRLWEMKTAAGNRGEDIGDRDVLVRELARIPGVNIYILSRVFADNLWTDMDNRHRRVCFGTIASLYAYAKHEKSVSLQRLVVRNIDALVKSTTDWGGMSPDAIELQLYKLLSQALGEKLDEFIDFSAPRNLAAPARTFRMNVQVADDMVNRGMQSANLIRWVYHGLGMQVGDDVGEIGGVGEVGGVSGIGEVGGVSGIGGGGAGGVDEVIDGEKRKQKKKKAAAFDAKGVAADLIEKGVSEAGDLAARES